MNAKIDPKPIWDDIVALRSQAPLVHNITNFVVMNNTANALLALGASPVMAHAPEEIEEMIKISSALVINIGTLNRDWTLVMGTAMEIAAAAGVPTIFDPVGAGATTYRTRTCHELLTAAAPTIIRGNASEIMALTDATVRTKGVDSRTDQSPQQAAEQLAREQSCVVVVSGATDLITDGKRCALIRNGDELMTKVTGLGCTATALAGAFAGVQSDPFQAAISTMAVMGICGELAAAESNGPGSLQMNFIDSLYRLNKQQVEELLRGE